mmetsp:Transcript_50247/g.151270  ORF Transcript_50247/g.151270 Transcript_50247/m.151270 type:complete len:110 (+) Transcript_50247:712-1041(+)
MQIHMRRADGEETDDPRRVNSCRDRRAVEPFAGTKAAPRCADGTKKAVTDVSVAHSAIDLATMGGDFVGRKLAVRAARKDEKVCCHVYYRYLIVACAKSMCCGRRPFTS